MATCEDMDRELEGMESTEENCLPCMSCEVEDARLKGVESAGGDGLGRSRGLSFGKCKE